jgi:hypothetical protein
MTAGILPKNAKNFQQFLYLIDQHSWLTFFGGGLLRHSIRFALLLRVWRLRLRKAFKPTGDHEILDLRIDQHDACRRETGRCCSRTSPSGRLTLFN